MWHSEIMLWVLGLTPIVLVVVGTVLLWVLSARPGRRPTAGLQVGSILHQIGIAIGWALLILGIIFALALTTNVLAIVFVPILVFVLIMAVMKYWVTERRALFSVLAAAAERNVPLESAARAFASERSDRAARQARLLAEYLEAGVPLAAALRRSGLWMSSSAELAADLGQQLNLLGPALRRATKMQQLLDTTLRSLVEKFCYVLAIMVMGSSVVMFLLVKILPVFSKMFEEFDLELPAITQVVLAISNGLAAFWFLWAPLVLLAAFFALIAIAYYVGFMPASIPGRRWFWWRVDCAGVLQWLALIVRQERPLSDVIRLLAVYHPLPAIRSRLALSSRAIDQGEDWTVSLLRQRIVSRAEATLFKSAERVGNLAWAMEGVADGNVRRSAYRWRAMINGIFPVLIISIGVVVLVIGLTVFAPLAGLVAGLS